MTVVSITTIRPPRASASPIARTRRSSGARRAPAAPGTSPADETGPDEEPAGKTGPDEEPADEAGPDEEPADETGPDEEPADKTGPDEEAADEAGPGGEAAVIGRRGVRFGRCVAGPPTR
ncbi:hypothetical protein Aph02nite_41670 [Actinoplanes philippinensis]|nr:hypothetical protein Aph02nite_41670 [Actinoplanes philippinensis]